MEPFSHIQHLFEGCKEPQARYQKLIELGRRLKPFPIEERREDNLVAGCQSQVWLTAAFCKGKIFFQTDSDALISRGLAALLLAAYDGQTPTFILTQKPTFIEPLQIAAALSPGRSSGFGSIYLHMQRLSIKFLSSIA